MANNHQLLPVEYQNEKVFVQPHKWISDGSFAVMVYEKDIDDINHMVSAALFNGEATQPVSTECVDDYIRLRYGAQYLIPGRSFLDCVHKGDVTQEECLLALIGQGNPFFITVATQDHQELFNQKNTVPIASFDDTDNLRFAPLSEYQHEYAVNVDKVTKARERRAEKVEMKKTISKAKLMKMKRMS